MDQISPKYMMTLIKKVKSELKKLYSISEIQTYLKRWIIEYGNFDQNFNIRLNSNSEFELDETLNGIDDETLLKIAIDLEIETPDFIPCIPLFKNEIKSSYNTASKTFERACSKVDSEPDSAVSLANAALESIIKEILKDERLFDNQFKERATLYKLVEKCLQKLGMHPSAQIPNEIKKISSGLLSSCQAIEAIRSDKTLVAHGKTDGDYVIEDSNTALFVVNAVTTIGLFLIKQYHKKYPIESENTEFDLPF